MADTKTTEQRQDAALESIAKSLGTTAAALTGEAPGDPPLARTITLENIAAALAEAQKQAARARPEGSREGTRSGDKAAA